VTTREKTALSRQYAKLCDLRDFGDPDLLDAIRSLIPERDPREHIERKAWEYGMVMLFLGDTGHLDGRSEVLSVGAGIERILFWLTNRVGRVVATDIYGEGRFAGQEAPASMLSDPAAHAPAYPWRPDRLEVLKMDARALEFPDESFDAVFTISSIEHFGTPGQVALAAAEMGRVLRPGGHAAIVTDYLVRRHPLDSAPVDFGLRLATLGRRRRTATPRRRAAVAEAFTRRELERHIISPSGLQPMQSLDETLSPEAWENVATALGDGRVSSDPGRLHAPILLRFHRSVFTSVCLALVKPPR
jgi:SAM-dependent methyltransferase